MRRFTIAALIVVMGAVFTIATPVVSTTTPVDVVTGATLTDQPKQSKKSKKAKTPATTELVTRDDTLAYAAGMVQTVGLLRFLQQQHNVDTTHIEAFLRGYNDAMAKEFDDDHYAYIAGMQVALTAARNNIPMAEKALAAAGDTVFSRQLFNEGFNAALLAEHNVAGAPLLSDSLAQALFREAVEMQRRVESEEAIKAGELFLKENSTKEGVVTTASGLQYKILVEGDGAVPTKTDEVTVKYEGRLIDGTVFDSSYKRKGQTNKFRANQVIKGWTEALTMMPVGSKWELYIPQELAYGSRKMGSIPPYSALIFTVELVAVN